MVSAPKGSPAVAKMFAEKQQELRNAEVRQLAEKLFIAAPGKGYVTAASMNGLKALVSQSVELAELFYKELDKKGL